MGYEGRDKGGLSLEEISRGYEVLCALLSLSSLWIAASSAILSHDLSSLSMKQSMRNEHDGYHAPISRPGRARKLGASIISLPSYGTTYRLPSNGGSCPVYIRDKTNIRQVWKLR